MLLIYNYNQVIRPRCDLLREKVKHFQFEKVFALTDEEFCQKWDIDPVDLKKAKKQRKRKVDNERDTLW